METNESLEIIATHLDHDATVKNVYGDPIVTQGKTILPVATVKLGMGSGYGKKQGANLKENKFLPGKTERSEDGSGAGGGMVARPSGVFEITGKHTRYIPASATRYVLIGALAGLLAGRWLAKRQMKRSMK